ncbi:PREDICTED: phospholipid phosphatase-related protein type 2-like [Lepidothrix coronata]|uniref:Phospholipid phosphatase-related protein type 2-like n=1 Tax=Lepidothrix coronata TaxID=321398 RepID=A0A6J0J8Z3_9PASS|nr:PREDICTED: phospholipid phosphatase-related protein type 2-like [Lepidothrix coronata]
MGGYFGMTSCVPLQLYVTLAWWRGLWWVLGCFGSFGMLRVFWGVLGCFRVFWGSRGGYFGVTSCVPLQLYVTLAWRGGGSRLAKPAAVLGFAAPPFLLGALRVAEHRNSWGDVLGGFLCGTGIAAFLVTCVVGNFQNKGESGWGSVGGPPRAPQELPPPQPPLEEISVTQVRRAEFPAVT